jgi:MFS family permease
MLVDELLKVPQRVTKVGRALRHRNFRLFFSGQIISLIGSWLTTVATSWLVYKICRHSIPDQATAMLGFVAFASQFPIFLIVPFAGVWVDRWNKRSILILTQTASMLQSFALAYLTLSGQITISQIIFLCVVQGIINAFDMPARQSYVVEMVDDKRDLGNAIALNSSMVHTARLLGPSIAGILISTVGEGYCFLVDGFSYGAVLTSLVFIRTPKRQPVQHKAALEQLKEGLRYAWGFPPARALLLLVATASLMFTSQSVLMPVIADKILHGNEKTLGFLLGASGLGALTGSLYLASRESIVGLGRVILRAATALGIGLFCFGFSRTLYLSAPILLIAGLSTVLLMASSNTILQTIVDDDKRGRIMSLFSMAFMGTAPFGALLSGYLASWIGAPNTFISCGLVCLLSAWFFKRKLPGIANHVRPIYVSKGILSA